MSYSEQRTNLKKAYDLLEAIIDKEERLEEAVHKLKCWHKNTPDTIRLMYDQAYLDFEVKKYQRYLAIAKRNYALLTDKICNCERPAVEPKPLFFTPRLAIAMKNKAIDMMAEQTSYNIPGWPYLPNHYKGIVEPVDFQVEKNGNDFNVTSLSP